MSKTYVAVWVLVGVTAVLLFIAAAFGKPTLVFVAEITALVAIIILALKLINWAIGRTRRPGNPLH